MLETKWITPNFLLKLTTSVGPSHVRWRAESLQHALAQSFGIALTGFGERDDFARDDFIGKVAAIGKSKRYQGHFERQAHDPDRLRVELVAI